MSDLFPPPCQVCHGDGCDWCEQTGKEPPSEEEED
jgi:hypothetical protein